MKDKSNSFWPPVTFALILGIVSGATVKFLYAYPSADWAANGQPIIERWFNEQIWFVLGFLPGALVGLILGLVLFKWSNTNEHE